LIFRVREGHPLPFRISNWSRPLKEPHDAIWAIWEWGGKDGDFEYWPEGELPAEEKTTGRIGPGELGGAASFDFDGRVWERIPV
jgi:hypothetical protein